MSKNIVSYERAKELYESGFPQPTPERGQFWYLLGREEPILVALYIEPYIYSADIAATEAIFSAGPELGKILFGVHTFPADGGGTKTVHNVMFYAPFKD